MKVLVTGSNGQLGSEIKELVSYYSQLEFIFKDLPEANSKPFIDGVFKSLALILSIDFIGSGPQQPRYVSNLRGLKRKINNF